MIALWAQQAQQPGPAEARLRPAAALRDGASATPRRSSTSPTGTNALFGGSCCPARPGFDLATGWGSPMANAIAGGLIRIG